jgi:hypothetical protein
MGVHRLVRAVVSVITERGVGGGSRILPLPLRIRTPYTADSHPHPLMPGWPSREGRTAITLELKTELVEHLDAQASYLGCSRAAYIRGLVIRDMERQGPGRKSAQA